MARTSYLLSSEAGTNSIFTFIPSPDAIRWRALLINFVNSICPYISFIAIRYALQAFFCIKAF